MGMVKAICTQCGGKLDVDSTKEAAVCPFCGTPFIVEKAINNYNHSITNNISANEVVVFKDDRYEHLYNRLKYFADNNDKIENHSELEKALHEIKEEYPYKNDELFDIAAELIKKNRKEKEAALIEKNRKKEKSVDDRINDAYNFVSELTNQFNPHKYMNWLTGYEENSGISDSGEFRYPYINAIKKIEDTPIDSFLAGKVEPQRYRRNMFKYNLAVVYKKTEHGAELKRYLEEYDIWFRSEQKKKYAAEKKERKEKRKEDLLVVSGVLFSIVLMILFLWGCCRFLVWIW